MQWQTIKQILWSAAGGAIVWWILLSAWLGWVTPGYAAKQAGEQTEAAVLEVLTPICLAQFHQDDTRVSKLAALKQVNTWGRGSFVTKQGWATMPGASKPRDGVAGACAEQLLAVSPS
jgi:hypothetical protein